MKSAKNLLIPFIVMILLALGVGVNFAIDKAKKNSVVNPTDNTVDLLYVSPVDISSVSVLHKEGNLNVKVDKKNSNNGSNQYTYSGSDKGTDSYSQSVMGDFISAMTSFVGCTPVTGNGDISQYGLTDPQFTVTINKTDGSSSVILIGNLSPDPSYCYVCAQGSSSVYLVSSVKYAVASKVAKDFIDARVLNVALPDIATVRFVRKTDSLNLIANCIYDDSTESCTFRFTEPFEIESSSYFDRLIEHICDLEANEYEDSGSDNITKFGLSSPEYRITLKTKAGREVKLEFSSAINGFYYGRMNGEGKIFKISSGRLESLSSPLLVLINDYVFYETCDNVDSIECTGPEKKFVMKIDVAKGKSISDAGSTVTLDGRNARVTNSQGRSYAAMLYETIFCINIGGVDEKAVISENAVPVMTITVFDHNHSSVVYSFYRRSDDSCYVCKDGKYTKFYIFNRELYNDGGTDTYDYGIWPAYEILTKAITSQINGVYDIPAAK